MSETPTFTLSDGKKVPAVGFGGMQYGLLLPPEDKPKVTNILLNALHAGHRFFDTCAIYQTEDLLGNAIRASGVPREEITVVTKLAQAHHDDPAVSLRASLDALDVGYVDIFLMHWPSHIRPDGRWSGVDDSPTFVETWKKMEKLVGPECRSIGVCNLSQKLLDVLLKECTVKPVVNQIEVHPFRPSLRLVDYCQERGIQVLSWGPLCGGPKSLYVDSAALYNHPLLAALSSRYHTSTGGVIISWLVRRGILPIPHSSSPERMVENLRPVPLTDEEVEQMNRLHEEIREKRLIDAAPGVWGETEGKGRTLMGFTLQEMGWEDEEGRVLV
ncbi:hypothetical protein FQN55_002706 [Onygenales sp. PD_40]|nr:hypothetical protein FQN55_002706 [Onygenales sp. PD_40]